MDIHRDIEHIAEENNGIIRTRDIVNAGMRREILARLVKDGVLDKEGRGIYALSGEWLDEYSLLQKKYPKCIFSYGTAMYFWGMSDKVPDPIHVSVPQGYNATCVKQSYEAIQVHFVKERLWEVGVMEAVSPQGGKIKVYNKERCICDLIKNKESVEMQVFTQAIKDYFKNNEKNIRRLQKYAELFSVEEKVRFYMEVLM